MSRVFRSAVELDEYLSSLTPEQRVVPPRFIGFKDQVDTAQREGVAEREARLGKKARWVPNKGLPDWVRLGLYDTLLRWSNHEAMTCIHQPHWERPQTVYAAAWKPGVVVCAECTYLLAVTGAADKICDGCGHECAGLPDDGIMSVAAFCGPLGYQFGVCMSCEADMRRLETAQQLNTHENKEKES